MPPGHSETVTGLRRLTRRERWLIAGVLGVVAALAVVVMIALAAGGRSTGHGCIDVNLPYSIGGQELFRCGAAARSVCAAVGTSEGFTGAPGRAVAVECRKVSLPVGAGSG